MKYALIDVGSNTIRLVIYEVKQKKAEIVFNYADYSGILSQVHEGKLSAEGFEHVTTVLSNMAALAKTNGCGTVYAFATASLRDIEDKAGLVARLKEQSGVDVHIITGEQEAEYDYIGLRGEFRDRRGAAFDLGGGSCQLMYFENGRIEEFRSMPIGSLLMYNTYVGETLPSDAERQRIREKVRQELSYFEKLGGAGFPYIYAMGGAARAALKTLCRISGKKTDIITRTQLDELASLPQTVFEKLIPERLTTIIPAIITISEIMDHAACGALRVTDCGVRDGILHELINGMEEI